MSRELSYLYRFRAVSLRMNERFFSLRELTPDSFDVLLAINMVTESEQNDTVATAMVRKFMNNYIRKMHTKKFTRIIDELHDLGYVWIGSVRTISITMTGKRLAVEMYNSLDSFEKETLRPVARVMTSGKINKDGLLIAHQNLNKNRHRNRPYVGVIRHTPSGKWYAYLTSKGKEINVGLFDRPLQAAKARDKYIRENKLPNKLSL